MHGQSARSFGLLKAASLGPVLLHWHCIADPNNIKVVLFLTPENMKPNMVGVRTSGSHFQLRWLNFPDTALTPDSTAPPDPADVSALGPSLRPRVRPHLRATADARRLNAEPKPFLPWRITVNLKQPAKPAPNIWSSSPRELRDIGLRCSCANACPCTRFFY